jgi:H+/Cl- antiporter ClcA
MPVIWGLDLRDMQWSKFKSSYMFGNKDYHLRRTKFVVYQVAMICCVVSESIGTAALSDYVDQQQTIERLHSSASVHNDDFVGIASYNIFCGVAVATIFGAGFFFDLFFPERYEPRNIRWAWRLSALFVTLCTIACAFAFTVIVATGNAWISANSEDARQIAQEDLSPPTRYRDNGRAIAATVFLWIGMIATVYR